jgi:hypothetical protein
MLKDVLPAEKYLPRWNIWVGRRNDEQINDKYMGQLKQSLSTHVKLQCLQCSKIIRTHNSDGIRGGKKERETDLQ